MKLRIRRLEPDVPLPAYQTPGAAAFDLSAAHDALIEPDRIALVGTGLVIEVPAGHFLAVFARSSLPIKKGLLVANGVGIVDADYCGPEDEIKVELLNVTREPKRVAKGERIAQGVVMPCPRVEWEPVDRLERPTRGGFGATRGYEPPGDAAREG